MKFDTDEADKELWKEALELWGFETQFVMVFEEFAELQKEVTKTMRGMGSPHKTLNEIADVYIVLNQLKYILQKIYPNHFQNINESLDQAYKTKKLKLKGYLEEGRKKSEG